MNEVSQPKQVDLYRCFLCKNKVSVLGYSCSYCNSYCLPDDHKYDANFMELAKAETNRNSPNITAAKIENI